MDPKGNYTYQPPSTEQETTIRRNAANEFLKFFDDLKKIKDGNLDGFQAYINVKFKYKSQIFIFLPFRIQKGVHNQVKRKMMSVSLLKNRDLTRKH